jgi:hypothetical protein
MLHEGGIDSLTLEIDRLASSSRAPGALRPGTTGELEAKSTMKLSKQRTVIESYVDKPTKASDHMRPRAPMMSRRAEESSSAAEERSAPPTFSSRIDAPQDSKPPRRAKMTPEYSSSAYYVGSSSVAPQYPALKNQSHVNNAAPLGRSHSSYALAKVRS